LSKIETFLTTNDGNKNTKIEIFLNTDDGNNNTPSSTWYQEVRGTVVLLVRSLATMVGTPANSTAS